MKTRGSAGGEEENELCNPPRVEPELSGTLPCDPPRARGHLNGVWPQHLLRDLQVPPPITIVISECFPLNT